MLVVEATSSSNSPSLLDSPTLARVERARLRQERVASPLNHSSCCQSLLSGKGREIHTIKKGLLWQQRDRIFSRWKERYFILTRDYLHCFKRSSGSDKISEMGQFIFKVKLVEVERVEWINKKTYSTVALAIGRDGRVLLRAAEGLEDWFELLEECMLASKERRRALRVSHDPTALLHHNGENNNSVNSSLEEWLLARHKIAGLQSLSDSVPDLPMLHDSSNRNSTLLDMGDDVDEDDRWLARRPSANQHHRLSLLTDIDINSVDMSMESPSVPASYRGRPTSYRLNSDVFFMSAVPPEPLERLRYTGGTATPSFCSSRSVLTSVGSFRSTHLFNPTKVTADRYSIMGDTPQLTRYRDRAQSEVNKLDRHNWKIRGSESNRRTNYAHATQV